MNERTRAAFLHIVGIILITALLFATYYATSEIVPIVSTVVVILFIMFLWYKQRSIEEREYQFITIVTHKFRTPLTGIKWAIEAFKKEVTMEEKTDILKQMENNSNKLMEIVDLLIGFVKFNQKLEYAFEATSLQDMVQESLEKYRQRIREKNMNFTININPNVPLVVIDRRKIQFVIDMLIDNAVKYTPEGGQISVAVEPTKDGITLAVADNGIGMSSGDMKLLFKKFFRSTEAKTIDTEGMGMGLHTAKVIMSHHKGKLWATSPGKNAGSTFYITLPLSQ